MTRRLPLVVAALALASVVPAAAQTRTQPRSQAPPPSRSFQIGGYGTFGLVNFTAVESFKAVLGKSSGAIVGGGATVGLPLGGLFIDIGAWRFTQSGERAFVLGGEVFPLGIPLDVTIIPIEISAGWKFRMRLAPKITPYVAGGYTSYGYRETSSFADSGEDVDERFGGYHLLGGAEFKIRRWLGVGGEVAWTTVPDAIGIGGVSAAFDETDLGGTSFRVKITVGR